MVIHNPFYHHWISFLLCCKYGLYDETLWNLWCNTFWIKPLILISFFLQFWLCPLGSYSYLKLILKHDPNPTFAQGEDGCASCATKASHRDLCHNEVAQNLLPPGAAAAALWAADGSKDWVSWAALSSCSLVPKGREPCPRGMGGAAVTWGQPQIQFCPPGQNLWCRGHTNI